MSDRKDVILFIAMATFWASNYPVSSIGISYGNPFDLLYYRILFAFIGILVIFNRKIGLPKDMKSFVKMTVLALFNVLIFMNLWFYSETMISSSLSAIIIYTYPITASLMSIVFLKEKFVAGTIVGIILGFMGMILIFYSSISSSSYIGIMMSFGGSVSWAIGTVYYKKYMLGESSVSSNFYQFAISLVPMVIIAYFLGNPVDLYAPPPMFVLAGFLTGVPGTAVAYYSYLYLFRKHEIGRISSLLFIVPAISVVMSYFILGTTLSLEQLGGMALIIVGIIFSISKNGTKRQFDAKEI
ncbi:MAG: DMT family transporter [Candidatus Thermoplasmatota archaeon]|nr:DMT family transporter [Candidatus Thermoplasmatota archaeon]MCL5987350.1 DMT family transporter [Candidatus Thermoplasmatota archaeon]